MDLLHNTYGSFRRSDSYKHHATLFSFKPAREQQSQASISDSIKVEWNFNSIYFLLIEHEQKLRIKWEKKLVLACAS